MIPAQNTALGAPAISTNGSAPRCEHLDGLQPVTPRSDHCRDCQDRPASLVVCLSCGWVACRMTHRTGTPGRTTRRPTTRSPAAWSRDHAGDGATSTSAPSEMPGPARAGSPPDLRAREAS